MTRPRRARRARFGLLATVTLTAAACATGGATASPTGSITVAAASSLRFAFEEAAATFRDDTGIEVTFSFGSSGQLREQIVNGAPFDLFASADVAATDAVLAAGHGDPASQALYATGRIVLVTRPGAELPGSVDQIADPRFRQIAIANPVHAPYGVAAEQVLESAGVLGGVQGRLVYGENISDAVRIVQSGNADLGLVALSLVIGADDPYLLLDDGLHEPLRQALVVTATGDRARYAARFVAFLAEPEGRRIMAEHGFGPPDGPVTRSVG